MLLSSRFFFHLIKLHIFALNLNLLIDLFKQHNVACFPRYFLSTYRCWNFPKGSQRHYPCLNLFRYFFSVCYCQ
ncbi:hypothetical protein GLYMA_01G175751v4 [Glycine max]|nr:hypothetical protein GLYMA_01G175751v4 [Glycine max]